MSGGRATSLAAVALTLAGCTGGDGDTGSTAVDPLTTGSVDIRPAVTEPAETGAPVIDDAPTTEDRTTDPPTTDAEAGTVDGSTSTTDVTSTTDAGEIERFCGVSTPDDVGHEPVDCDEPHDSVFAGFVDVGVDVLPAEQLDAEALVYGTCAPLIADLIGRPVDVPGIGIGFLLDAELGGPIEGDAQCFVEMTSPGAFEGYVGEIGFDAALGDEILLTDLDPGTCFVLAPDSNDLGIEVGCDELGALVFVGTYEADERPYPGIDQLRLERAVRCADLLERSGIVADPDTLSGTIPNESVWEARGLRTVTCDAVPA